MFGVRRRLDGDSSASSGCQHRRYFRCPAEMPIGALVKFLRSKFDVTNAKSHKVGQNFDHFESYVELSLAVVIVGDPVQRTASAGAGIQTVGCGLHLLLERGKENNPPEEVQ